MRIERDPSEYTGKNPNTPEGTTQPTTLTPWEQRITSGAEGLVQRIDHAIGQHLAGSSEDTSVEIPE